MSAPGRAPNLLRFGVFELDLRSRELRKQGTRIRLQDKPFELLALLVERAGQVVTREEIRQRLWTADMHVVFDDGLNTAVRKVRDALGDTADSPRFVETVPRRGYRFVAAVEAGRGSDRQEEPPTAPAPVPGVAAGDSSARRTVAVIVAAAAVVAALMATTLLRRGESAQQLVRFEIAAPPGTYFPAGAPRATISPNGRHIAFLAGTPTDRVHRLWIQSLDSSAARPVPGTEYAFAPSWSPDSRLVAFVSYGKLHIVDAATGEARDVCGAANAGGIAWIDRERLLFDTNGGLGIVAIDGGAVPLATTVDAAAGERLHTYPQMLPGGRRFLYLALNRNPDESAVYAASLDGGPRMLVLKTRHKFRFVPPDRLLLMRGRTLVMQRFDPDKARLRGEAEAIAADVGTVDEAGDAGFSTSDSGVVVFSPRKRDPLRQLVWFDRSGRRLSAIGVPDHDTTFSLSADNRWLVVERLDSNLQAPNLWVIDLARGVTTRATERRANDESPAWAPDSRRYVYARHRAIHQVADLYIRDRESPQVDDPLLVEDVTDHPTEWSPDGRYIMFERQDPYGTSDLWALPLDGPRRAFPWLQTRYAERQARFSPDGRRVAYASNEDGRSEIYVRTFQPNDRKWKISDAGGARPFWRADGRELFYVSADFHIMAASVAPGGGFDPGVPAPLFDLNRVMAGPYTEAAYAAAWDGRRFLVNTIVDEPGDPPITVLMNIGAGRTQ